MDTELISEILRSVKSDSQTVYSSLTSSIYRIHELADERVLANISRRPHNNLTNAAATSAEFSHDSLLHMSDVDKTLARALYGVSLPYTNGDLLDGEDSHALLTNYFARAYDTLGNKPPATPSYADILVSQTLSAGQPCTYDSPSFISFLIQDNLAAYTQLKHVERSLLFKLIVANQFASPRNLCRLSLLQAEITRHKQAALDLLTRLVSLAVHSHIVFPDHLLTKVFSCFLESEVNFESKDTIITRLKTEFRVLGLDSNAVSFDLASCTKRAAVDGASVGNMGLNTAMSAVFAGVDHWITTEDVKASVRRHVWTLGFLDEMLPQLDYASLVHQELTILDAMIEARTFNDVSLSFVDDASTHAMSHQNFVSSNGTENIFNKSSTIPSSTRAGTMKDTASVDSSFIRYVSARQLFKAHNMSLPIINALTSKPSCESLSSSIRPGMVSLPTLPYLTQLAPPTLPLTVEECVGSLMVLGNLKEVGITEEIDWSIFFTSTLSKGTVSTTDKAAPRNTVINTDALIQKILTSIDSATSMQGRSSDKELLSGKLLYLSKELFSNLTNVLPHFFSKGIRSEGAAGGKPESVDHELEPDTLDSAKTDQGQSVESRHNDIYILLNDDRSFDQLYQPPLGDSLGRYYTDPGYDSLTPYAVYTGDSSSSISGDGLNQSIYGINTKSGLNPDGLSKQEQSLYDSLNILSLQSSELVYDDILRVSPSVHSVQKFLLNPNASKPRAPIEVEQLNSLPGTLLNDKDRLEYRNVMYAWKDAARSYSSGSNGWIAHKYCTTAGASVSVSLDKLCAIVLGLITTCSANEKTSIGARLLSDEAQKGIDAWDCLTSDCEHGENSYLYKILYTALTYIRFIALSKTWTDMVLEMTKIHAILANTRVLVDFLGGDFSRVSDITYSKDAHEDSCSPSRSPQRPAMSSKRVLPPRPSTALGVQTTRSPLRSPLRELRKTPVEYEDLEPGVSQSHCRSQAELAEKETPDGAAKTELDVILNVQPIEYSSTNFAKDPLLGAQRNPGGSAGEKVICRPPTNIPGTSDAACRIAGQCEYTYNDLINTDSLPSYISPLDKLWYSLLYLKRTQALQDSMAIGESASASLQTSAHDALPLNTADIPQKLSDSALNHLFLIAEDGVYSLSRKKLVFQSAIADVAAILRDDHIAISIYISRVFARMKTAALRLCFKRSSFYRYLLDENKDPESSPNLAKLGNKYMYENLGKADKALVDSVSLETVVDRLGILYDVLTRELQYLCAKRKAISCIYESLLHTYDVGKAREIQQVIYNLAKNRPKCFLSYPSMPCFNDELNVDDLDSGLLANHSVSELPVISAAALTVRMLPHPAYPLEVEIKTMHHLVGILTSAIDHEMKHHYTKVSSHVDHAFISQKDLDTSKSTRNEDKWASRHAGFTVFPFGHVPQSLEKDPESFFSIQSPCTPARCHVVGAYIPTLSELYRIPLALNQASAELFGAFISESNPKLFTTVQTVLSTSDGAPMNKVHSFPIYTAKLSLTCRLSVARVFARESVRLIKLWRANGSTLPKNTQIFTNSGLLGCSRPLIHLLETAMVQKKADSDKSICNTVSSDKNIVAERLVCSLIGLMVPAGGGYIGKGTLTIKEKAERAQQILEQQQKAAKRRPDRAGSALRKKLRSRAPSATGSAHNLTKSVQNNTSEVATKSVLDQSTVGSAVGTSTLRVTTKDDLSLSVRDGTASPGSAMFSATYGGISTFSTANFSAFNDPDGPSKNLNDIDPIEADFIELDSVEFGPLAEHFARSVTLKDIFIYLDQGARIQVSNLLKDTDLRVWEGYPDVLPMPFFLLALLLNLLWSRHLLATTTVFSHVLRNVELSQVEVFTGEVISRNCIPLFPRLVLASSFSATTARASKNVLANRSYTDFSVLKNTNMQSKMSEEIAAEAYNYKEYVSYDALLNNLPFLATIDVEAMHYLLTVNTESPIHLLTCLLSEDFDLGYGISTKMTTILGETLQEVLNSGNIKGVCDSPLISDFLQGVTGIFGRTAHTEVCLNSYRSAVVRNNQFSAVFAVMSKAVHGYYDAFARRRHLVNSLIAMDPVETQSAFMHKYKCMKVGLFFANSIPLVNATKDQVSFFVSSDRTVPLDLSNIYYVSSEETLSKIALLASAEFRYRTKQFHSDDHNPAALFAYRQALFYTCCQALLTETKRTAITAQIKGQLSALRSVLQEINQDKLTILLDSPPLYRGVLEQAPSMNSTEMILTAEGFLSNPFTIPHPITFQLESNQISILEIILVYLTCLDSVVQYAVIKTLLNSSDIWFAAGIINDELKFMSELQHVTVHLNKGHSLNVHLPSDGPLVRSGDHVNQGDQAKALSATDLFALLTPSCIYLEDKELQSMNCALTSVVHEYLSVISVKGYARPKDSKVIRDIKENSSYILPEEAINTGEKRQETVLVDREAITVQSKTRVMEMELEGTLENTQDDIYVLYDTAKRNLEYCKLDIFVKKLIEMKDRVDLLLLSTVAHATNSYVHKGLGLAARSFLRTAQILAVRYNYQLGMHGFNLEVHPTALYTKLATTALQRSIKENAGASPYTPFPGNSIDTVSRSSSELKLKHQCLEPYDVSLKTPFYYHNKMVRSAIEHPHTSIASYCTRNSNVVVTLDPEKHTETNGSKPSDQNIPDNDGEKKLNFTYPLQANIKRTADYQIGSVFSSHPTSSYAAGPTMSLMACMNIPVMDGISNFHSRFALTNAVARIQLYKIGISSSGLTNRLPLLLDPVVFHYISGSLSCGSQQASPLTIRPYIPSTIRAFTSFSYINTYNASYSSPLHIRALANGFGINGSIGAYFPFGLCYDFTLLKQRKHSVLDTRASVACTANLSTDLDFGESAVPSPSSPQTDSEIFPGSLYLPAMITDQSASLLAGLTSLELDALCITELTRSSNKEREQPGYGAEVETDAGTNMAEGKSNSPSCDRSSWAGKKIESILASRIIEQDRLERLYLRLHGFNDNHKHSALLSPVGIFGVQRALQMMRIPFIKKLQETRQQEDELNKKRSVFDRSKGPTLVALKKRDMQTFLVLPLFVYMSERTTDKVAVKADVQSFQECLFILRSVQTEVLCENIKCIAMRQLWRRIGYLENNLAGLNKYNALTDATIDFGSGASSLGSAYINFLSSIGEGVRLSQMANVLSRERSNAKASFGISSLKQIPPSIIVSMGLASGLVDTMPSDIISTSGFRDAGLSNSAALSAKIKATKALVDILETGIIEGGDAAIKQLKAKAVDSLDQAYLSFDDYSLMNMYIIRIMSGFINFTVSRLASKLKRELLGVQIRNPMSFLYTLSSVYTAAHANALSYTLDMPSYVSTSLLPKASATPPLSESTSSLEKERFSLELLLFRVENVTEKFNDLAVDVAGSMAAIESYFTDIIGKRTGALGLKLYKQNYRNIEAFHSRKHALREEITRRALASLNPVATAYTEELTTMTLECYNNVKSLHIKETCLRNALHAEMSRRILLLYDSILLAKRHRYLLLSRKQDTIHRAVLNTRKSYMTTLGYISKDFAQQNPASEHATGAIGEDNLGEYDYDIIAKYDAMLKDLTEEWGNVRIRLHLERNFSNLYISHLRTKLSDLLSSIGDELSKYNKDIWIASARGKEIELTLGSRVHNLQAIIADKTSETTELRAQIDGLAAKRNRVESARHPEKMGDSDSNKPSLPGLDKAGTQLAVEGKGASIYGLAAKKFLPELSKAAVKGGIKLCTDAEVQLIQLKKLSVERESLAAEKQRLEQAINQIRRQSSVTENNLRRSIQKERHAITTAETQCTEAMSRATATKASVSVLQQNAAYIEDEAAEQDRQRLLNDIDNAMQDVASMKEKIGNLTRAYPELFLQDT
ncbi:Hypothetical protein DHA2_153551 [Giardia duodenalis]|uniref:Uncharacterized protein n=1 Tax=Giardia intestinalis TaxID=5741 RepID=V6TE66_GIAIN|nr:Hypothetical protein DHA2_153551 [Giardia intestinalis]